MNPQVQNADQAMQALAKMIQAIQGGQGGGTGMIPGRQTPYAPQPPVPAVPTAPGAPIQFSTQGAGAPMTQPVNTQSQMGVSKPDAYGVSLMSQLDPKGASVYAGVQGVSQFLEKWNQSREQKKAGEAANIAQNLTAAVSSGDTAKAYEILTDPKATKLLDKVYKGWLTKAQDAQTPDKTDPEVQAFESGMQKYLQGKTKDQPTMPNVMGGRMVPQAPPAELSQAAAINAQLQRQKQDPASVLSSQMSSQQQLAAQLVSTGLVQSPREAALIDAQTARATLAAYAGIVKETVKQNAITDRIMKVTDSQGYVKLEVGKMNRDAKVEYGKILADAYKYRADVAAGAKRDTSKDPQTQALIAQKSGYEKVLENLNTNYQKAVKDMGTNPKSKQAADMFKQQIDLTQATIDQLQGKLDAKSDEDLINSVLTGAMSDDGGSDDQE